MYWDGPRCLPGFPKLTNHPAILPVDSAGCRLEGVQCPGGSQRTSERWQTENRPAFLSANGQRFDPPVEFEKILRGHSYRAKSPSQIDGPWIVLLPLQIQLRTGKGRLREKIVELLAGPRRRSRGLRHFGFLAHGVNSLHNQLIHRMDVTALDFLLYQPLGFGFEFYDHTPTLARIGPPCKRSVQPNATKRNQATG